MAQFFKQGAFGFNRMVPADDWRDPDISEVRLTPDEYEDLILQVRAVEEELKQLRGELETAETNEVLAREEVEELKKNERQKNEQIILLANKKMDAYKTQIDHAAEKRIAAAEAAVLAAEKRIANAEQTALSSKERLEFLEETVVKMERNLQKQIFLNNNLKRIARERANADRGITPKKDHDGYLVLSSRQWVERYEHELTEEEYVSKPDEFKEKHRFPYTEHLTADVWKSVIQTPYDASLPISQIGPIIEKDDLLKGGILVDLGCTRMSFSEDNGEYGDFGYDEEGHRNNGLYKWVYNANYKSGFWELEIYTTKNLRVPPGRRPEPIYKKKPSKKKKKESEKPNEVVYEFDDNDDYI